MLCPSCMAENAATRRFCAQCGAALPVPCPAFGFENETAARFRGGCGRPIGEIAAQKADNTVATPRADNAERRQLTVMFCDLVGSTALSAQFDPEELREEIRTCQNAVCGAPFRSTAFARVVTIVATPLRMGFEWDERKRESSLLSHKVDFIDVLSIFDGTTLEIVDDGFNHGETRIRCLGEIEGRAYVVVYTWRGVNRRIISARKANARERRTHYARKR